MHTELLLGSALSAQVLAEARAMLANSRHRARLCIIDVTGSPEAERYSRSLVSKARGGIGLETEYVKRNVQGRDEALGIIERAASDSSNTAVIVQTPLPHGITSMEAGSLIPVEKDADFMNPPASLARSSTTGGGPGPATASAVCRFLDAHLKGPADICIVNRSTVVGKPLALMLTARDHTVTVCHSRTRELRRFTASADVVVVAVGRPGFLTRDDVREGGSTVIDVGTSVVGGKLVGGTRTTVR
ncbi:bifunctional 5,10-methylenetetrahydrofolate dehydrogenase/5,10-methenyltetrahydrofolate cyclohydrolase [Thermogymnomonas acidicola]|uniref:bifunctional 5,10-methylenetetrahydrofolate dehydrogenase/5,10-methenyltetrahydrofolate cyclohydrolase n=1 Tax=Thermogymnomonas acidicola TaxID=399579 RepID=UPI00149488A0|nr:bifunctional 5,10-methylenetetrahydrofolate dehydrogenase/5,10-methenyltetrahydrofolate cyclohydrolase [Thermogymnomonas acidicola]